MAVTTILSKMAPKKPTIKLIGNEYRFFVIALAIHPITKPDIADKSQFSGVIYVPVCRSKILKNLWVMNFFGTKSSLASIMTRPEFKLIPFGFVLFLSKIRIETGIRLLLS